MTEDEIILYLDRQSQLQHQRTREVLISAGRQDLADELDLKMKEIRLGISMAASTWHSISSRQRFVLQVMAPGRYLSRSVRNPKLYDALGNGTATLGICRIATARKLCAHDLIHVNGGATDPEAQFVITEHGKFVFAKGRPA